MKRIITILLILFLLNSCKNSNCTITSEELLTKDSSKIFGTHVVNGKISEFRDKGKDSVVAGYYSFYDNGHLKSYQFFANIETYVYNEEYDENGILIKMEGNPLVHNIARFISSDSLFIKMYLFSMNKIYQTLEIKTMNNKIFNLELKDDNLYSTMKYASFGFNFKGYEDIKVYINVTYRDVCTNKNELLKDTIALHYDRLP